MAGCFASKPDGRSTALLRYGQFSGMVNCANPARMHELLRLDLDITQGTQSHYYLFLASSLLIGRYLTWASFTTQASRKL
jgi:hypothetical protein